MVTVLASIDHLFYASAMVNMPHMLKYVDPRGHTEIQRTCFFLATKAVSWLLFGMVIFINHPHTLNCIYVPYVTACVPQDVFKYKGPVFSYQPRQLLGSAFVL